MSYHVQGICLLAPSHTSAIGKEKGGDSDILMISTGQKFAPLEPLKCAHIMESKDNCH